MKQLKIKISGGFIWCTEMRFKILIVSPTEEKKLLWVIAVIGQTVRTLIFVPVSVEFHIFKLQWSEAASAQCCICTVSNTNPISSDYSQG